MPKGYYGGKTQNELQKKTEKKIYYGKMATLSRIKNNSKFVCMHFWSAQIYKALINMKWDKSLSAVIAGDFDPYFSNEKHSRDFNTSRVKLPGRLLGPNQWFPQQLQKHIIFKTKQNSNLDR